MLLTEDYKKLLDYNNENGLIKITDDDVVKTKREYDKDLECAYKWIDAEKDGWNITIEHRGYGNFGKNDTEVIIRYQKKEKVDNLFEEEVISFDGSDEDNKEKLKKLLNIK